MEERLHISVWSNGRKNHFKLRFQLHISSPRCHHYHIIFKHLHSNDFRTSFRSKLPAHISALFSILACPTFSGPSVLLPSCIVCVKTFFAFFSRSTSFYLSPAAGERVRINQFKPKKSLSVPGTG